jgi:RND superfamily putative drug exporter
VLAICLVVVALGAWGARGAKDVLYGATVELAGTDSARVARALREDFDNPFAELLVVAAESPGLAVDDPRYRRWLEATTAALRAHPDVEAVASWLDRGDARMRSADGRRTFILVGLTAPNVQEAEKATPRIRAAIAPLGEAARAADPGFRWATTGRGALSHDIAVHGARDSQEAEARVIPIVLVILVLAFGALVAAGVPLAMGLAATAVALGVIAVVGRLTPLSNMVQNVGTMVGLAVGIDYSLLLISRFREALARGLATPDALAETLRTAGVAVAASGVTVIIGMAGPAFTPSLDTRSIGLGGAIVVFVGVLLALTFLPALLAVLGPRLDAPRALAPWLRPMDADAAWRRWAAWVMRRPVALAVAGSVALLAMCAPLLLLSTRYEGSKHLPTAHMEFHAGYDILAEMGRKNASTPIQILVTSEAGPVLDPAGIEGMLALSARLHADPRVSEVLGPVDLAPGLTPAKYRALYKNWRGLVALAPGRFGPIVSRDGRAAVFSVVAANPVAFEGMTDLARDIRSWPAPPGLRVALGGQAAFYADLHAAIRHAFPGMVAFVIGATFLVLALAYRCWLVPLKATVLNLLSVGAGCGALVVLFQFGWGRALIGLAQPTDGVPLALLAMVFCVVFGLSMDYEVFLISRIKEIYDETGDNALATERGLAATGGLITAAALIMVAVFGGFAWANLVVVKMLGVGLGVAVLVDATIVRVLLAPALMRLAGDWNWHPGGRRPTTLTAVVPQATTSAPTVPELPR